VKTVDTKRVFSSFYCSFGMLAAGQSGKWADSFRRRSSPASEVGNAKFDTRHMTLNEADVFACWSLATLSSFVSAAGSSMIAMVRFMWRCCALKTCPIPHAAILPSN
jgi:hypothetical protein